MHIKEGRKIKGQVPELACKFVKKKKKKNRESIWPGLTRNSLKIVSKYCNRKWYKFILCVCLCVGGIIYADYEIREVKKVYNVKGGKYKKVSCVACWQ